ncbi:MAG: ketoacyl-ACP synthase III [Alphaproteobacteria bacterium]|nr:ketoacyl-ACP synthase III [Alphaproteobacteria bacterium]
MIRSIFLGCGAYLPATCVTNEALIAQKGIDSTSAWIERRTGIKERHFAAPDEKTSDMATQAAKNALAHAGLSIDAIDLIILATTTPDDVMPSTAARVQANLNMTRGFAFDIQAVCSGFVYALTVADNFIRTGQAHHALVIGADKFSKLLDWEDRSTCLLFGDGAGAVVLGAKEEKGITADQGILLTALHSDGRHYDLLKTDERGLVRMNGSEVFRHAVTNLSEVVDEALEVTGLKPEDIDWLVPHQANQRIIDGTGKKLALPKERIVTTIARHANTSAASIPLALAEAVHDGRIQRGQLILFDAMGAGFTWGLAVARW